jgi:hypothetical protein
MAIPALVRFVGGSCGPWQIDTVSAIVGEGLPDAGRLRVVEDGTPEPSVEDRWMLRGVTSNTRYTRRPEMEMLAGAQAGLGRAGATRAALIPIRKSTAWWDLAQDERRAIFEEQSRHIRIGLDYLPAVARRLHHSRDLGEPFDFLTWFEFAPEHTDLFDKMVDRLRGTPEWRYVDREVDIRLSRTPP